MRVLDALVPPVHTGERPGYLSTEVEFICGSVTDRGVLREALEGVDAVCHFAAYQDYLTDFSHFFLTNSVGTALLYELIVNERLPVRKVVVASWQSVYGEGKYRCPNHDMQYPGQRSPAHLVLGGVGGLVSTVRRAHGGAMDRRVCGSPAQQLWPLEAGSGGYRHQAGPSGRRSQRCSTLLDRPGSATGLP